MIPQTKPTILVIDDEDAVRHTLTDMLEINGYTVEAAANGTAGLALARRTMPAVILTDIGMPGMDGYEVLRQVRLDEDLRGIPVIVLTAKAERAATRKGMEMGADDFITKPFTEDEVVHSIEARLEKKELLDEIDAFANTVANDLRKPLATLNGRLGLLLVATARADEATRQNMREAGLAAARLATIIDELLLLAGVRRQQPRFDRLNMGPIVGEALARVDDLVRQSEAKVTLPQSWPAGYGHTPWMVHVWCNYLVQALRHGGPKPVLILGAAASADGRMVRFWVQDHGPGLTQAAQASLFTPFTRISKGRSDDSGLGLAIARRIVEKFGGQVGLDSQPGEGSCLWFELPANSPSTTHAPFSPG